MPGEAISIYKYLHLHCAGRAGGGGGAGGGGAALQQAAGGGPARGHGEDDGLGQRRHAGQGPEVGAGTVAASASKSCIRIASEGL